MLAAGARRLEASNTSLVEQIAQRERAEREAEILSDHNEMILQAARDGISGVNAAGRTTFFNPAAEDITGYMASEVIGKMQHDLLHHKRADGSPYPVSECPIMATLRDGKVHSSSNETFWRRDGRPVAIEFTSAPLSMHNDFTGAYDEDGKQVGAVIIFRDISERKKTETALRELASIVQGSDDAIIAFRLDGSISRWNRAATKIYGYSEAEMVGQHMDKLIPLDAQDELPGLLAKLKSHQPVERYETTRLRKDGTAVQVVLSLSPMLDDAGEIIGASSISREVFRDRLRKSLETKSGPSAQDEDNANHDGDRGSP